jgi:hypothetical protein
MAPTDRRPPAGCVRGKVRSDERASCGGDDGRACKLAWRRPIDGRRSGGYEVVRRAVSASQPAAGTSRGAAPAVPGLPAPRRCCCGGYEEGNRSRRTLARAAGRLSLSSLARWRTQAGPRRPTSTLSRVRRMSLWLAQAGRTRGTRPAPSPATRRPSPLSLARPYCSSIRTYAPSLYSTLLYYPLSSHSLTPNQQVLVSGSLSSSSR